MTAIAALSIADGAASPVTRTFSPVNIDVAGVAKWADRSSGVLLGFPTYTQSLRAPNKRVRTSRVTSKMVYPVLDGDGLKKYELVAIVDFIIPESATQLEREHIYALTKNAIGHAVVSAAVEDLESVY